MKEGYVLYSIYMLKNQTLNSDNFKEGDRLAFKKIDLILYIRPGLKCTLNMVIGKKKMKKRSNILVLSTATENKIYNILKCNLLKQSI